MQAPYRSPCIDNTATLSSRGIVRQQHGSGKRKSSVSRSLQLLNVEDVNSLGMILICKWKVRINYLSLCIVHLSGFANDLHDEVSLGLNLTIRIVNKSFKTQHYHDKVQQTLDQTRTVQIIIQYFILHINDSKK